MHQYKITLLSLLLILKAAISFSQAGVAITDTLLPQQYTDLGIRFQHFEPLINDKTLIAAWQMDEGSGYEFLDASGKNHTAYITGYNWNTSNSGLTTSFRKKGKRNGGVYMDGSQWLQVKDTADLQLNNSFSICFWYKLAGDKGGTLISRQNTQGGFSIACNKQGDIGFAGIDENGKSDGVQANYTTGDKADWQFIAVTYHHKTLSIFINGVMAASKNNVGLNNASQDLYIGTDHQHTSNCFKGYIDEVCIYNEGLTPARIEKLYTVGLPKIYTQHNDIIRMSDDAQWWTGLYGNQPVPHSRDNGTVLLARFAGNLLTEDGLAPVSGSKQHFVPGTFGGALMPAGSIIYKAPVNASNGTAEIWTIIQDEKALGHKTLLRLPGDEDSGMELYRNGDKFSVDLNDGKKVVTVSSHSLSLVKSQLLHVAITWVHGDLQLWINGLVVAKGHLLMQKFKGEVQIGGNGTQLFTDAIDDVSITTLVKQWSGVCPSGNVDTESASLDFRDDFEQPEHAPLFYWKPIKGDNNWAYQKDGTMADNGVLAQQNQQGLQVIVHPAAFGDLSSMEAGVMFKSLTNGWAGIGVDANTVGKDLRGATFCLNGKTGELRLNVYQQGKVTASKTVHYDFPVKINQRYTLTLSYYGNVVNGFMDGNPVITIPAQLNYTGYGGLVTENTMAGFDDVHFSALPSSPQNGRLLRTHLFSDAGRQDSIQPSYKNFSYNAFRWKKRYGLLPWQRTFKDPEPAGDIFGQDVGVARPNKSQSWRSEDAANSDLMMVNGTIYYSMRGNPDMNGPHGPAAIGMLTAGQDKYDGLHFTDLNADDLNDKKIGLLQGHQEAATNCVDGAPRNQRLQVNDQGMVYINGKIIIVAREFRNAVKGSSKFRRLVYGVFDVAKNKWDANVVNPVPWSAMDPANCQDELKGLNGTPDLSSMIDPTTGETVILMYYEVAGKGMVTGLKFDGKTLQLHPGYPPKPTITKSDNDRTYGQRVFFDNGIYYMNVNAGSDSTKLKKDWPDRFQLFTSLNPCTGPWSESADSHNKIRPYFTRGSNTDPDNGAIWQGTMFKYRNQYYMYYENYHSVNNVNNPYDQYDKVNSGSRVGFATAN